MFSLKYVLLKTTIEYLKYPFDCFMMLQKLIKGLKHKKINIFKIYNRFKLN